MQAHDPGRGGILQVHPTRLCNLTCAHCYSASSPSERDALSPELLSQAVEDAARIGFDVVSLSGGEPLVYDGLPEVLQAARRAGCRINLVSNGILIGSSRYRRHAGSFNVVALSLDGLAPRHNAVRGSAKSYEQVRTAARVLKGDAQAFGIIHTLTSEALDEVEELAAIAAEWGAALLQLHPFEPSGRGSSVSFLTPLSEHERLIAYLLAAALAVEYPQMRVQLDLVHRDLARHAPHVLHAAPLRETVVPRELVIQDDGLVVPLTYGMSRGWAVADLKRQRLADAWPGYLETPWPRLRRTIRAAAVAVGRGRFGDVVAWHSVLRQFAEAAAARSGWAPLAMHKKLAAQGLEGSL